MERYPALNFVSVDRKRLIPREENMVDQGSLSRLARQVVEVSMQGPGRGDALHLVEEFSRARWWPSIIDGLLAMYDLRILDNRILDDAVVHGAPADAEVVLDVIERYLHAVDD